MWVLFRMYARFHELSPDEMDLRPSLPFVQEMTSDHPDHDNAIAKNKSKKSKKKKDAAYASKLKRYSSKESTSALNNEIQLSEKVSERSGERLRKRETKPTHSFSAQKDHSKGSSMSGYLLKKSHHKGGMQYIHGDPWRKRFFVLENMNLFYYITEEEVSK